jgi:hypothetical protein
MNITEEKKYIANLFGFNFQNLSASYLRMESLLSAQQQIQFNVQENIGTPVASEQRLKQSDQFVITHIGFAHKKIASATPTAAQQAVAKLYLWPNSNTGLFDGSNDANLWAIYNGWFEIALNRKTYVPAVDMRSFLRVPNQQEGQPLAAIAGPITYPVKGEEFPNGLFGYFKTDYIRLNGYDQLQPQINLPASVTMNESGESNYAVLLFKGYLAQNEGNAKNIYTSPYAQ